MGFLLYTTFILFLVVCLFLIMLVLIQKGRGGGLASAFGGGGGNTAFGSKTGDVLTWATSIVFGVFLVLAITLNLLANNYNAAARGPAAPPAPPAGQTPPPSQTEGSVPGPTQPDSSLPKIPPGATDPGAAPKAPTTAP